MEIKEIFIAYWWLSLITIPMLAFILWLIHQKAIGKPLKVGFDGNRSNVVKRIVFVITMLNFGVWGVGTVALPGEARSGKREQDTYFVKWNGRYTEVSRGTYLSSYLHTCLTIGSLPLAILLLSLADIQKNRKKRFTENRE